MARIVGSVLAGVGAALVAAALSLTVEFGILASRIRSAVAQADDGAGGLGAVSVTSYAPWVAAAGFVAGFWWQYRRIGQAGMR